MVYMPLQDIYMAITDNEWPLNSDKTEVADNIIQDKVNSYVKQSMQSAVIFSKQIQSETFEDNKGFEEFSIGTNKVPIQEIGCEFPRSCLVINDSYKEYVPYEQLSLEQIQEIIITSTFSRPSFEFIAEHINKDLDFEAISSEVEKSTLAIKLLISKIERLLDLINHCIEENNRDSHHCEQNTDISPEAYFIDQQLSTIGEGGWLFLTAEFT